jgi:D-3-phosphoglycerate dehydrogenase / 2-oxoglutarate reductase
MSHPHILVADWVLPDFELEMQTLQEAGVSWNMPSWKLPPPPREQQRRELLTRIAATPRIDGVLFQLAPLDAEVIAALPDSCRILQRMGTGLDTVDLDAAARRNIAVHNTPNYCLEEVAVHTMSLLLALHRQLISTHRRLLDGQWSTVTPKPIERLSTLTLGIVGLGRIGRCVAERMKPLVGRILFCDPAAAAAPDGLVSAGFHDLLRESDIVSLHCPLVPESRHLLSAETLRLLKPTALVLNVARGGLIDARALADALNEERLAGAGVDVYEPEVLPADSPLRTCKNILLTSHTAWYSRQAVRDARTEAMDGILKVVLHRGEPGCCRSPHSR